MTASFRIGRLAGVEIGIHWSWLVIFALLVWSLADAVFPSTNPGLGDEEYLAMALIAVAIFFASLLLHELGHATRAAREGMEIAGITLWLFGGVAQFRGMFPSAGAEFRIAIAGPLVTLAIGTVALALALAVPLPAAVDGVVFWLGYVNLVLLGFNMLPALPLDGGRVLRSALWARRDDFLAATRTAAAVGQAFGQLLIGLGVFLFLFGGAIGGLWLVFIGWFLLIAAEAERTAAETHRALSGITVGDVMVTDPVTAEFAESLAEFMQRRFYAHRHTAYPVIRDGAPAGLISYRAVLELPRDSWDRTRVGEAMTPLEALPEVAARMPLEQAVERLAEGSENRALVLADGRLAGLLSITDATRVIEARRRDEATPDLAPYSPGRVA